MKGIKHVYLIGAGFTRAVMGEAAPLTEQLWEEIDIANCSDEGLKQDYKRFCPNIEAFLSVLDLCIIKNEGDPEKKAGLEAFRKEIEKKILKKTGLNNLNVQSREEPATLHRFVDTVPDNTCFLSLNYDCVLDQALWLSGKWGPRVGYGIDTNPSGEPDDNARHNLWLIKLHGSDNFTIAENGYCMPVINEGIFEGLRPRSVDMRIGEVKVILMSYVKHFNKGFMRLWRDSLPLLAGADRLSVIGCSLRDEDTFLRYALYHFGARKDPPPEKLQVDIVDIGDAKCEEIKQKLKRLLAWPGIIIYKKHPGGLAGFLEQT